MKKEYSTPTMKAIMVNAASMLCGSDGELNQGNSYISGNNDYIEGGGEEGGFPTGIPD